MATQLEPTNRGPYTHFQNKTIEWPESGGIAVAILTDNLPEGTSIDHFNTIDLIEGNYSDDIDALEVYNTTLGLYFYS